MSYMWPDFEFQSSTRRYKLFKYRDASFSGPPSPLTVVFIPGNRGSYKQVRSFGSHLASLSLNQGLGLPTVYSLDLHEEWSALSGWVLHRQQQYVNTTLHRIADRHGWHNLIVLAHSMGGLLVKSLDIEPSLVITLATPHAPVLTPWDDSASLRAMYKSKCPMFNWISIGGGLADLQVSPHLTIHMCSSVQFMSTAIAGSWTSVDHKAIMWCNALIQRLARGVLESQSMIPAERMTWWTKFANNDSPVSTGSVSAPLKENLAELDTIYRNQAIQLKLPTDCNLSFYSSHAILPLDIQSLPSPQQAAALEQLGRKRNFDDDLLPGVYHGYTLSSPTTVLASHADWSIVSCTSPSNHSVSLVSHSLLPWPYRLTRQTIVLPKGIKHTVWLPGLLKTLVVLDVSVSNANFAVLLAKNDHKMDVEYFHYVNLADGQTAKVSFFTTDTSPQSLTVYTASDSIQLHISVSITSTIIHAVQTYAILLAMLLVPASYTPKHVLLTLVLVAKWVPVIKHTLDATWTLSLLWILALLVSRPFTLVKPNPRRFEPFLVPTCILAVSGLTSSPLFPRTLPILARGVFSDVLMACMCVPSVVAWIQAKAYFTRPTMLQVFTGLVWTVIYNGHLFGKRTKWEAHVILACVLLQVPEYVFPSLTALALLIEYLDK